MAEQADRQERLEGTDRGRRRAAGIYGAVVTAAVIAAVQDQVPTRALVVAVLVTLLVYWIAEEYAELLGEHAERGHLPHLAAHTGRPGRQLADGGRLFRAAAGPGG